MKILIINGPNLNLLGTRETDIYGNRSFEDYFSQLKDKFTEKNNEVELFYFQSNVEGELINELQKKEYFGFILNAGGYTHTSVSIRDCIAGIEKPVVEVHISNLAKREEFRHNSLITGVCSGSIMGFGLNGYDLALDWFLSQRPTKVGY
jgi:3-dehydroquinate dehydratase II